LFHIRRSDHALDSGQHAFHKRRVAHQHGHRAIKVNFSRSTRSPLNAFDNLSNPDAMSHCYIASTTCHDINSPETGIPPPSLHLALLDGLP
jgi:hypothetical protein